MEKPYSGKALADKLKSKGIDVAEEAAKAVAESVMEWLQESAVASVTPFDDLMGPVIAAAKPHIMEALDKIDGQVG